VVFLTGGDSRAVRLCIAAVCETPGVVPVAVLVDTHRDSFGRRMRNLRRNIRREGWSYALHRYVRALRDYSDRLVDRCGPSQSAILDLLRRAFPARHLTLANFARAYNFEVREAGNLNGPEAVRLLQHYDADLGIVLGTRVLKPSTFRVPRMGCINLHKGKVPDYRGMPPGFWELYDGAQTAGVTVHFVDQGLDTGDVIETAEVPIQRLETPESLAEQLDQEGARALARAVGKIAAGNATAEKQAPSDRKARTKPTRAQVAQLHERLPHWPRPQSDVTVLVKNAICLAIFHSGVYGLSRRRRAKNRAAILLYHRVNDFSQDVLTIGTEGFAAHLLAIRRHYPVMSTRALVECIRDGKALSSAPVLIHFDDAYRDVYTDAAAILTAAGVPATGFVSSGFVDTDRAFQHDVDQFPFRYENCRREDLERWIAGGFEIGAHTVNHVNLGQCGLEDARFEIVESGRQLQEMIGQPIALFSFPFGGIQDIREEARSFVKEAGYTALFSAHGGFAGAGTSLWDIPRIGAGEGHKPLYLLLEIEGLTPAEIRRRLQRLFNGGAAQPRRVDDQAAI
jgi:folate-dependent phosphoribosylglycinamide formyltransferase PurN/peptidoglycan/xylan/chitin deacetylase (PgdA/CDA1 family)